MVLDLENIPVLTVRAQRTAYRRCRTPGRPGGNRRRCHSRSHTRRSLVGPPDSTPPGAARTRGTDYWRCRTPDRPAGNTCDCHSRSHTRRSLVGPPDSTPPAAAGTAAWSWWSVGSWTSSTALYVGMGWMAVVAIVPLVRSLPVSVT